MAKNSKDASICSLHPVFGFGVTDGKRGYRSSSKAFLVDTPAEEDLGKSHGEMKVAQVCSTGASGRQQSGCLFCAKWEGFRAKTTSETWRR